MADCVVNVKRYSESVVLIIAYLVERTTLDFTGLKAHLKRRLPDYMVPSHFERITEIPLTATGKANHNALPEPELVKKINAPKNSSRGIQ